MGGISSIPEVLSVAEVRDISEKKFSTDDIKKMRDDSGLITRENFLKAVKHRCESDTYDRFFNLCPKGLMDLKAFVSLCRDSDLIDEIYYTSYDAGLIFQQANDFSELTYDIFRKIVIPEISDRKRVHEMVVLIQISQYSPPTDDVSRVLNKENLDSESEVEDTPEDTLELEGSSASSIDLLKRDRSPGGSDTNIHNSIHIRRTNPRENTVVVPAGLLEEITAVPSLPLGNGSLLPLLEAVPLAREEPPPKPTVISNQPVVPLKATNTNKGNQSKASKQVASPVTPRNDVVDKSAKDSAGVSGKAQKSKGTAKSTKGAVGEDRSDVEGSTADEGNTGTLSPPLPDLKPMFNSFCANNEMTSQQYVKMMKDTAILSDRFTLADIDLIYAKAKNKAAAIASVANGGPGGGGGGRGGVKAVPKVNFELFISVIVPAIADRRGDGLETTYQILSSTDGPKRTNVTQPIPTRLHTSHADKGANALPVATSDTGGPSQRASSTTRSGGSERTVSGPSSPRSSRQNGTARSGGDRSRDASPMKLPPIVAGNNNDQSVVAGSSTESKKDRNSSEEKGFKMEIPKLDLGKISVTKAGDDTVPITTTSNGALGSVSLASQKTEQIGVRQGSGDVLDGASRIDAKPPLAPPPSQAFTRKAPHYLPTATAHTSSSTEPMNGGINSNTHLRTNSHDATMNGLLASDTAVSKLIVAAPSETLLASQPISSLTDPASSSVSSIRKPVILIPELWPLFMEYSPAAEMTVDDFLRLVVDNRIIDQKFTVHKAKELFNSCVASHTEGSSRSILSMSMTGSGLDFQKFCSDVIPEVAMMRGVSVDHLKNLLTGAEDIRGPSDVIRTLPDTAAGYNIAITNSNSIPNSQYKMKNFARVPSATSSLNSTTTLQEPSPQQQQYRQSHQFQESDGHGNGQERRNSREKRTSFTSALEEVSELFQDSVVETPSTAHRQRNKRNSGANAGRTTMKKHVYSGLRPIFNEYCPNADVNGGLTILQFTKMLKERGVFNRKFSIRDAEIIYSNTKSKASGGFTLAPKQNITFEVFSTTMIPAIASKRLETVEALTLAMVSSQEDEVAEDATEEVEEEDLDSGGAFTDSRDAQVVRRFYSISEGFFQDGDGSLSQSDSSTNSTTFTPELWSIFMEYSEDGLMTKADFFSFLHTTYLLDAKLSKAEVEKMFSDAVASQYRQNGQSNGSKDMVPFGTFCSVLIPKIARYHKKSKESLIAFLTGIDDESLFVAPKPHANDFEALTSLHQVHQISFLENLDPSQAAINIRNNMMAARGLYSDASAANGVQNLSPRSPRSEGNRVGNNDIQGTTSPRWR